MTTATTRELQKNLGRYLRGIEKCPVVITKDGKPVAMLVAPDEETLYELSLINSPRFLEIIAESQRQIDAGEYLSHEEFWKGLKARTSRFQKPKRAKESARRA